MERCGICFDTLSTTNITVLECGHMFHFDCIVRDENRRCPLCRRTYANDVPLSFHQLFSRATLLMDMAERRCPSAIRLRITHELLDTLLLILEQYGDAPAQKTYKKGKLPFLRFF